MNQHTARVAGAFTHLYYYALVLMLGGFLVWFTTGHLFVRWYIEHVSGPRLQRRLGFRAAWVPYRNEDGEWTALTVTDVSQAGCFQKSGVKPGDVIWSYHGLTVEALYGTALEVEKGEEATLRIQAGPRGPTRTIRFLRGCAISTSTRAAEQ